MSERPLAGDGSVPDLYSDAPIVVSYSFGLDSTAILAAMYKRGMRPDMLLFADVGSEHDYTYEIMPVIQDWLASVNFPPVTTVRYALKKKAKHAHYVTIFGNCIANRTLPSLAFGGKKGCSIKWKGDVLDDYVLSWPNCVEAWQTRGIRTQRLVGYDCSCKDAKRFTNALKKEKEGKVAPQFHFIYPLQYWKLNREGCAKEVHSVGLPVIQKSSCYFCPSMKPDEVLELTEENLESIVLMEALALPGLRNIKGLWGNGVKRDNKPATMTEFIRRERLLPEERITWIIENREQERLRWLAVDLQSQERHQALAQVKALAA